MMYDLMYNIICDMIYVVIYQGYLLLSHTTFYFANVHGFTQPPAWVP